MQTSTVTPQRKPRRTSNQFKGQRRADYNAQLPTGSDGLTDYTENMRQQSYHLSPTVLGAASSAMFGTVPNPITPPRPRSMYAGAYSGQLPGNVSASDSNDNRRKNPPQSHAQRSKSSSINSRPNVTPRSKSQKNTQTPKKTITTPSQAYAGPTFHASPAPSSLPIPKFFQKSLSKSVPETTQAKGLAAMMDSEVSEEAPSPESSEPSPVREKAERLQQQAEEGSPLDIFFRADKEEKARARLANITNLCLENTPDVTAISDAEMPRESSSLVPEAFRHHSRQHTGSSAGGLFSIDMEQEKPEVQSPEPTSFPTISGHHGGQSRANSAPCDIVTVAGQDETARRNARSAELMRLLGTEKPTQPSLTSPALGRVPTTGTQSHQPRPTREPNGPSATTPKPERNIQILSRKQPASLPKLQREFGCSPSPKSSPRAARPPSNLRRQVSGPPSPAPDSVSELPATPTPYRTANLPSTSHRNPNSLPNHTSSPSQSTAFPGVGSSNPFLSIENEIRRALRIDILGSDGPNGV